MITPRTWIVPRLVLPAMLLLGLAGCLSVETPVYRYYRLVPLAEAREASDFALGLGPVQVAKYLDVPQVIVRVEANEIQRSKEHRWAGPLQENVYHVMEANLAALSGARLVMPMPMGGHAEPGRAVALSISLMDGTPGGEAELKAQWLVYQPGSQVTGKAGRGHRFEAREPVSGTTVRDLVDAQSRLLLKLSEEIAAAVTNPE